MSMVKIYFSDVETVNLLYSNVQKLFQKVPFILFQLKVIETTT